MNARRRIEKLRVLAAARGVDSGPRVWAVLPDNGREDSADPGTPVVNGSVVIVSRRWTPTQIDIYFARLSRGRTDKVVFGVDLDRM